jgi:hypothetical protein
MNFNGLTLGDVKHNVPKFAEYNSSLAQFPTMCTKYNSAGELVYVPPPQSSINLQPLNLKSEVDRRKIFKYWCLPFMDVNQLAAAVFFFTNRGDVVCCAFCGVEVGHWIEGDDEFKDHQR